VKHLLSADRRKEYEWKQARREDAIVAGTRCTDEIVA
jgi:hypothetical protein